ncbi:PREDICTED: transcription elongation factor B polypeptide 3 [Chrysochloris asiatica]|uniref:Elongin-A n=1 Tax=Chrysochloris asiatica TaxID=185453 RepID=A0A9B0TBC2_CHRAS|nr:PREDICTED: transcription elongation factor B polypeptide 3 [Chrysochloris asiatica]
MHGGRSRGPRTRREPSSGEEAAPVTAMAAESALQVVEKLQARLAVNSDPKKLLKYLKKLSTLPITVDILAETGVGKTVNSLRKHEHVGSFARDLVAQWKKLVPVERNTEPEEQDFEKSNSRKRPRDVLQKEEEMEVDYQENWKASGSRSYSPDHRQKKHRKLAELERPHKVSHNHERQDERKRYHRVSPAYSSDHESSDYGHVQSPPSSSSPHQMCVDHYRSPDEDHEPIVLHQKPAKGHSNTFQDRLGVSQERHLGESQSKAVVSQSKEYRSSHKEKRLADTKRDEKTSALSTEKSDKAISKEENRRPLTGDGTREKAASAGAKKEREREGSSLKKKFLPPLEVASDNHLKKPKHRDSEKTKSDKNKSSFLDNSDIGKGAGDLLPKVKEKVPNNLKTQEGKLKTPNLDKKSVGSLPKVDEADMDDEFEQPTMSFESYLSYDQPRKKKKKIVKTSTTALGGKGLKKSDSKSTSKNLDSVKKLPKVNENKTEKLRQSGADSAKLKKIPSDVLPVLPDLPLPTIQANYRPLPSLEFMSSLQPKRKVLSSPQEEEEAGFTGRRMNSKMQVYSGSKCAYLPKMMTLHQQCIRVLKNNIDSIFEVGGVPYSVLEPVLERCTPDQLYRIEEYNHVLIEDTDQLWKIHCHRDFKEERPEEYESWREMYLRLQDAREQRLRLLTKNIRSAHANKPKGRQAKMAFVNSVAKPPRDVRRRQEKFGTGAAVVHERIKIKPTPDFTGSSHVSFSSNSFNPSTDEPAYDGPSTSSAHLAPVVSSSVSYDPRKPAVKKIAPMMAKTIKAFKNRFSRR